MSFNNAMDETNRQANDARMQAVLAGGQEQSRLAGLALQSGQFTNQAQQQGFTQDLAQNQIYNQAQAQAFGQQQAQLAFNNAVSSGNAQAANQAAQTAYQQAVAQVQQNNANVQQSFTNQTAATQLQNQMNAQQLQQQFALQSFPVNQVTALMSGGQIQNPQVTPYQPGVIQPTNVAGNVYNSSALANQQYQQQLQQNNAMMGGLFGLGGTALLGGLSGGSGGFANSAIGMGLTALSDRRLKRNIVDLGVKLMNGIKLYAFNYLWDGVTRIGAMADEVMTIKPAAVFSVGGYGAVNYALAMEPS